MSSSAWAGLWKEAPVDEVEAVRNHQRGASRVHHYPEKKARKPGWQQPAQYAFSGVENLDPCMVGATLAVALASRVW